MSLRIVRVYKHWVVKCYYCGRKTPRAVTSKNLIVCASCKH